MRKVFISPHNDDECLFGAFTIMRHSADIEVVIVYDAHVQYARGIENCRWDYRRSESLTALHLMGIPVSRIHFLGLDDKSVNEGVIRFALRQFEDDSRVWFPKWEDGGNKHHNAVAVVAADMWKAGDYQRYLTYTGKGKSTGENRVEPSHWADIQIKLRALTCYGSQIELPDCRPHFLRSQEEYLV